MSRLLLLSILVLWMCPRDNVQPLLRDRSAAMVLFFGVYAAVVVFVAGWSRLLARRVSEARLGKKLDRYNIGNDLARYFVPLWFAAGVFALGWGDLVGQWLAPLAPSGTRSALTGEPYWRVPGLLIGTAPAILAWMGLWWAQYPVDRALKEQAILYRADQGLPIHSPPALATFFVEHIRQQLLFTLLPIILIVVARDLLALGYLLKSRWVGGAALSHSGGEWIAFPAAAMIFLFAPELLRRVIPTERMPADWPLRRRLQALCDRAGLRCRDILVWKTSSSVGNAMVMGLFPRVRYVFLSDLLLETMTDEEIEAVFAHEIGHIVHRHMWWYAAFAFMLMLFTLGPVYLVIEKIPALQVHSLLPEGVVRFREAIRAQIVTGLSLGVFVVMFGYLSRRFERQADVYAARTMTATQATRGVVIRHTNPELQPVASSAPALAAAAVTVAPVAATIEATPASIAASQFTLPNDLPMPSASYVGAYGATVVSSALQQVAKINNIPIAAREWLHGSIHGRMQYLQSLSTDPTRTAAFDRYMRRVYLALTTIFITLGAWNAVQHLLLA
jgi:Zn-dependent protease with chaperone function